MQVVGHFPSITAGWMTEGSWNVSAVKCVFLNSTNYILQHSSLQLMAVGAQYFAKVPLSFFY